MREVTNLRYRFNDVEVDVQNLRVTVGSENRPLEPKSFRLLQFLIENHGRVLDKDEIMKAVWRDTFVSDNSSITQIRKALNDDPETPKYIETIPTVGYRFVADLKVAQDSLAAAQRQQPSR